jgi:hypothetical protein
VDTSLKSRLRRTIKIASAAAKINDTDRSFDRPFVVGEMTGAIRLRDQID